MECSLNVDICDVIASNFYTKEYVLEEWVIASGNFSYNNLSSNPLAIDFLKKNPQFSSNISAYEFLKSHPQYITDEIGKMPYIFKKVKVFNKSAEIKSVLNMILAS